MARLPPLERGIGADRLARWHAMGGRYVITLVTGHAVAIIWGYAVTAHQGVTTETGTLLTSYPDVLMATVAGFLLLGIGLISARAARRRLAYETWYYAHLYTYIAIALAFSHQFADGASFTASLPARATWSALYLAVGTRLIAEGPYGAFTPAPSRRGVLLIAGGVGITPIRAMFAALPGGLSLLSGGITLLYRASHPRDIVFRRELDTIAAARGATIHYLIGSRDQLSDDPFSSRHLKTLVPGLHRHEAYICGPPGMTQAAVTALRAAGMPRRRIHHESFDF